MFTVLRYLKYLIFARHGKGHGIHSPFVYKLITDTFRHEPDKEIIKRIRNIRRKLLTDAGTVTVTDFGSGSRKMKSNIRKVSEIARNTAVPEKFGLLLFNLSKEFGSPLIVELGTSLGISSMYLAAASPDVPVYTIEGCGALAELACQNIREAGIKNIRIMNGSFDEMIPLIKDLNVSPGLVFIDGDHKKDSVIRYFNDFVGISNDNMLLVIDDISISKEMAEAWVLIKKHEKVTATIDLYRMGFVFLREGITRLHYMIRY
ncbi:MAG: O-methyltransferase [Bacteroidales bacterium]|jgi:predicted O-methyltransferase YrrM